MRRRWARRAGGFLISGALVLGACSSDDPAASTGDTERDSADEPSSTDDSATSVPVSAAPPEQFTGSVEDFYVVPSPLPPGAPGDLIRVQDLSETADSADVSLRVMYHSRDAQDRDRAVTGVITYPTAAAPADSWPVVSWAHGTTGLAPVCAPSRYGDPGPDFGVEGVRVATDYIGLGPVGERHAYLSGLSEAHSVIDGVRAARQLPDAHAGTRWVGVGHSQGGHSALWTNELGEAYAPELDLLGTAVIAPAAVLDRTFGPADQIVPRMVGIMALYGISTDHPDVDPDDYVGDEVRAQAHVIDEDCLDEVVEAMLPIPVEEFYDVSPIDTEPARAALLANDPGHVKVDAPLMLVYGTADAFVVPDRVAYLYDQLCDLGQVTALETVDDATHDTVVGAAAVTIGAWFEARFAGEVPPDDCGTRFPASS